MNMDAECVFDNNAVIYSGYFGTPFAIARYKKYTNFIYKMHSKYKALYIYRAYDNTQPKAFYIALHAPTRILVVGDSLGEVKSAITKYFANLTEVKE